MTHDELTALEALEKVTTIGPWLVSHLHVLYYIAVRDDATETSIAQIDRKQDVAFIAALRNAAPDLIAAAKKAGQWEENYTTLLKLQAAADSHNATLRAVLAQAEAALEDIARERGVIWEPGKDTAPKWMKHAREMSSAARAALDAIRKLKVD